MDFTTSGLCRCVGYKGWNCLSLSAGVANNCHLLQICFWTENCVRKAHKQSIYYTHTQKHKQTEGKASPRMSNAGSEAAVLNVTLDVSGHKDQKRGSPYLRHDVSQTKKGLPAPPLSQIITSPPKTRENDLIGMPFEFFPNGMELL